ncbi:hypothetical protein MKW98_005307, partial [Papaver atlanticum]
MGKERGKGLLAQKKDKSSLKMAKLEKEKPGRVKRPEHERGIGLLPGKVAKTPLKMAKLEKEKRDGDE